MGKYNLAESEVVISASEETVLDHVDDVVIRERSGTAPMWEQALANAVCTLCGTKVYMHRKTVVYGGGSGLSRYRYTIRFYGLRGDVAVSAALFKELFTTLGRMTRKTYGKGWGMRHSAYAVGMASRLYERATAIVQKVDSEKNNRALVVVRDSAVRKYTDNLHLGEPKKARPVKDAAAYWAGYEDGAGVDMASEKRIAN